MRTSNRDQRGISKRNVVFKFRHWRGKRFSFARDEIRRKDRRREAASNDDLCCKVSRDGGSGGNGDGGGGCVVETHEVPVVTRSGSQRRSFERFVRSRVRGRERRALNLRTPIIADRGAGIQE